MTRPIKYNAWDKFEKRMVTWEECLENESLIAEILLNAERYVPLQFTGRTDTNGKEIFDGHIVEFTMLDADKGGRKLPVVWDEKICGFHCSDGKTQRNIDMASDYDTIKGEVIGSIYTTPELLDF